MKKNPLDLYEIRDRNAFAISGLFQFMYNSLVDTELSAYTLCTSSSGGTYRAAVHDGSCV